VGLVATRAHPKTAPHVSTVAFPQPRSVTSQLVADPAPSKQFPRQYPVHIQYGTPVHVPAIEWTTSGATNVECSSATCWAAAVLSNQFEYPIMRARTSNLWRVGGPWIAGPWADACAGATHVRFFAPNTVMLETSCNWFYVSTDAGRHWYLNTHLAQPVHFSAVFPSQRSTGIAILEVTTRASGKLYSYYSTDGVRWNLN